jgi:hypothetical protein
MDNLIEQLKGMCNQSILMLVVSIIAVAKSLLDSRSILAMVLIINSIITVMVLNCLCKAECSNLAWLLVFINVINVLSISRIIFV